MSARILISSCLLLAGQLSALAGGKTAAVLSSQGGAYMEALSAFQAAYGGQVEHFDLSREKPVIGSGTKVIVAFGGKAAAYPYPEDLGLVYCLAPSVFVKSPVRKAKSVKISLIPDFAVTFARLKAIQPGLARLRVLWAVPASSPYTQTVRLEGAKHGIQVTTETLPGPDSLPDALRRTLGAADAVWLAPDPLIITPQSLTILRDFSWSNSIPFYGATKSMTREGAVASVGLSFAEMGKTAARAALGLSRGEDVPELITSENAELTLNASAAARTGIVFPRAVLDGADYLFP